MDFLLVDHNYRIHEYWTGLLRACEEQHLIAASHQEFQFALNEESKKHMGVTWTPAITKSLENWSECLRNSPCKKKQTFSATYEEDRHITASIHRNRNFDDDVAFYTQNGFADKSKMKGWSDTLSDRHSDLFNMVRVAPYTCALACA